MARTVALEQPVRRSVRFVYWLSQHWLLAFNIVWGAFVVAPWLAPVFMQLGLPGVSNGIYFVYQFFCHQLPERSFFLFGPQPMYGLDQIGAVWPTVDPNVLRQFVGAPDFGWKVAYSDRMVSMYTAFWFAAMAFALVRHRLRPLPLWGYALMILPMAIDGTTHFISDLAGVDQGFRSTNEWLVQLTGGALPRWFYAGDALGSFNSWARLITGALFGIASVWLAFPYAEAAFFEMREELEARFRQRVNSEQ
ncbi:MAG TPA: DUF2085 domain-containing protein [Anaerolineae bacterium]|nr:DUF2085 domain-containing protein [Anaerolineae bacterium]